MQQPRGALQQVSRSADQARSDSPEGRGDAGGGGEASAPTSSAGRPGRRGERRARFVWLGLALASGLFFALRTSAPALTDRYVVQDDVRQHVFWIPRLHDPELFNGDPIADYYAAEAPAAYVALYELGTLNLDPITFSKLLPIGLTVVVSGLAFLLGLRLFRRATAAGLGAILLTWSLWQYDDIASATPRSFATPLLVAALLFLVAGQRLAGLGTLVLQALLYPLSAPLTLGVQALWLLRRSRGRIFSPAYRRETAWIVAGGAIAAGLILLGQRAAARYGPVVSAEQARGMAEFQPGGRANYFVADPIWFWLRSNRSGLALNSWDALLPLPALAIPFGLAAGLAIWVLAGRLGLMKPPPVPGRGALLLDVLAASFGLFFAAHALLFRLYLPSRYVQFSLPVVGALGGGLILTLLAGCLASRLRPLTRPAVDPTARPRRLGQLLALGALALLIVDAPPVGGDYVTGNHPRLFEYLRAQPKTTLVAALPKDSSILPLFGQRPVLVSQEHALPYHLRYYEPLRRRTRDLLQAYYADSPGPILALAEREGVGLIVANTSALGQYRKEHSDGPLGLELLAERCGALRDRELVAVPVDCARRVAAGA